MRCRYSGENQKTVCMIGKAHASYIDCGQDLFEQRRRIRETLKDVKRLSLDDYVKEIPKRGEKTLAATTL